MHVIVAGCGRVGAALASALDAEGHDVVIIDREESAFQRLEEGYGGRLLRGIVFDQHTLEEAGIAEADALIAVTSGDNSNVVVARTARERYGVERVVARIYDPERASFFERYGIVTVASARWTVEEVRRALLPPTEVVDAALGTGAGDVVLITCEVPEDAAGLEALAASRPGCWTVAAVTREGRTEVPERGALVHPGDLLHLAVDRDRLDEARAHCAALTTTAGRA